MGILAKTLTHQSAYAAKNNGLWPELMTRLEECVLPEDVDAFERHVSGLGLQVPAGWHEPLAEVIAKKRDEIREEDLTLIMRSRFDF